MIDRKSAKAVYVQELISRDEMLSIFGRGTKESWGDRVKEEDKGKYLFLLGWGYENANSLKAEGTQEDVGVSVDFEMSEWGLKAYIQINAESGETEQEILYLDKEFLIDTSLWEYWKYNKN